MRIHRIQTGSIKLHREHVENKGNLLYWMFFTQNWTDPVPINTFLIEHPKGLVLFDTGESPDVIQKDFYPKWIPTYKKMFQPIISNKDSVLQGINKLGFTTDDIKYVVLSHLHSDHIGGMEHFPNATVVINEKEWEDGHRFGAILFSGYQKSRFHLPEWHYKIIGYQKMVHAKNFDVGYDLFEDGSLILVPTPGHTRGHQSMLVYGKSPACLAGDAIFSQRHLKDTIPFGVSSAKSKSFSTIPLLREWSKNHGDAPILAAHDPEAERFLIERSPTF